MKPQLPEQTLRTHTKFRTDITIIIIRLLRVDCNSVKLKLQKASQNNNNNNNNNNSINTAVSAEQQRESLSKQIYNNAVNCSLENKDVIQDQRTVEQQS